MSIFDLDGKTILVTGGYGFLGSAMSKGLAEMGAQVCVLGRSREKFDVVKRAVGVKITCQKRQNG